MTSIRSIKKLESRRDRLLEKLPALGDFLKGSINSVCAGCKRANCLCQKPSGKNNYRLTYKDKDQRTQIVYIPEGRLVEAKRLLENHARIRKALDDLFAVNIEIFKSR